MQQLVITSAFFVLIVMPRMAPFLLKKMSEKRLGIDTKKDMKIELSFHDEKLVLIQSFQSILNMQKKLVMIEFKQLRTETCFS